MLPNPKHEKFAGFLAEGKTASEAYALAGYKPNRHNAHTLSKNPLVAERTLQIKTEVSARVAATQQITREKLIEWHDEIRRRGMESGQLAPAGTAIKEISVLTGFRIERQEVGGPGEYEALNDDALERELAERIAQLGLDGGGSETQH